MTTKTLIEVDLEDGEFVYDIHTDSASRLQVLPESRWRLLPPARAVPDELLRLLASAHDASLDNCNFDCRALIRDAMNLLAAAPAEGEPTPEQLAHAREALSYENRRMVPARQETSAEKGGL